MTARNSKPMHNFDEAFGLDHGKHYPCTFSRQRFDWLGQEFHRIDVHYNAWWDCLLSPLISYIHTLTSINKDDPIVQYCQIQFVNTQKHFVIVKNKQPPKRRSIHRRTFGCATTHPRKRQTVNQIMVKIDYHKQKKRKTDDVSNPNPRKVRKRTYPYSFVKHCCQPYGDTDFKWITILSLCKNTVILNNNNNNKNFHCHHHHYL